MPEIVIGDKVVYVPPVDQFFKEPQYDPNGFYPNKDMLQRAVVTVKTHYRGYQYADIKFFRETLNLGLGIGNWTFLPTSAGLTGDPYTVERKPKNARQSETFVVQTFNVEGWCVSRWMYPVFGIGTALYEASNEKDPRHDLSICYAIAKSEALKNAAQQWGVAPNLKSGEGNDDNVADDQEGIKSIYESIVEAGGEKKALDLIKKNTSSAIQGGKFYHTAITAEEIDNLRDKLVELLGELA